MNDRSHMSEHSVSTEKRQLPKPQARTSAALALLVAVFGAQSQGQELVLDNAGTYSTLIDGAVYDSVRITGDDMEAVTRLNNTGNSYAGGTVVESGWLEMLGHYQEVPGVNSLIGRGDLTLAGGGLRISASILWRINNRTLHVTAPSTIGALSIGDGQYCGTLAGTGTLTKVGAGLASISNANTNFTGRIVLAEGRMQASSPVNINVEKTDLLGGDLGHGGTIRGGDITVMDGATLAVGGGNSTTEINNNIFVSGFGFDTFNALDSGNRGGKFTGTITLTGDTSMGNQGSIYSWSLSGPIVDDGHPHALVLQGVFAPDNATYGIKIEGDNAFTGDVVINRGRVLLYHANALGANLSAKTVAVNVHDSEVAGETTQLHVNTHQMTVGTLVLDLVSPGGCTATVRRASSGAIRAGTIVLKSGEFAALSATSGYDWAATGARTLVIDGNPVFSRSLGLVGADDRIVLRGGAFHAEPGTDAGQTGNATVVPAMTLEGGVLEAGGLVQTFGALTLAGDAALDFASGGGELRFADSSGLAWEGTLTVRNWLDDAAGGNRLFVGDTQEGLTPEQLARITTDNPRYAASQLPSGEIVFAPRRTVITVR